LILLMIDHLVILPYFCTSLLTVDFQTRPKVGSGAK